MTSPWAKTMPDLLVLVRVQRCIAGCAPIVHSNQTRISIWNPKPDLNMWQLGVGRLLRDVVDVWSPRDLLQDKPHGGDAKQMHVYHHLFVVTYWKQDITVAKGSFTVLYNMGTSPICSEFLRVLLRRKNLNITEFLNALVVIRNIKITCCCAVVEKTGQRIPYDKEFSLVKSWM